MTVKRKAIAVLLAALIGVAAFFVTNTAIPLDVTNDDWILRGYVERDVIQHYTGWLFYRSSHIPFPLGVTDSLFNGQGGAIAFSDSIPVMSVIFGLFSDILPDTFQYFGIYSLLSYILMAISASLLLCLYFDRVSLVVISSIPFIFSPIMLERVFRHVSLSSHFLIVFALYLYFCNRKEGFRFRFFYLILCFFAVTIHFYFVPMVLAILFADLLQDFITTKKFLSHLLFLSLNLLTVVVTAFLFGYFYTPTTASGVLGYGYFTMNLNSIFNPRSVSGIRWSLFLPALGQGLGSSEGFNYLGFGVLLAFIFIIAYFLVKKRLNYLIRLVKSHIALFTVCIVLTLFAVSTTVVINNNAYLRITLPIWLLRLFSVFRSSGRLFWVVNYLIVLFVIVSLANIFSKKTIPYILSALVVLQLIDLTPEIVTKREAFLAPSDNFPNPTDNFFFVENSDTYDTLFTFSDGGVNLGLYFAHYAITNGLATNEPFMARNNLDYYHEVNDEEYSRLMNNEIDISTLYIFDDVNRFFNAAVNLGDSAVSMQIPFEDSCYYVIAPMNEKLVLPIESNFILLKDIPLTIADYSDLTWTDGVLNDNKAIVTFYDNAFTKKYLEDATHIIYNGQEIAILLKNYSDPGWVMVTLDIDDSTILVGKPLMTKQLLYP